MKDLQATPLALRMTRDHIPGCCRARPPRAPAPPRSRARSPRGSPGALRGPRVGSGRAPVAEGARGAGRPSSAASASARSATRSPPRYCPGGPRLGHLGERSDEFGDGPSGSRRASASAGSVHRRDRRARVSTPPSVAIALAAAGRSPAARKAAIASSSASAASAIAPGVPSRVTEAGEHLGSFGMSLAGRARAPARGSRARRPCPGRARAPRRGRGISAPVPRARSPDRSARRLARARAPSRSGRRGHQRGPRLAREPWTRSSAAAATWRDAREARGS